MSLDNINHEPLKKLGPLNESEKETLSDGQKLELGLKLALSNPGGEPGQGYVGPMPVNKELQGEYRSEGQKQEPLPLHEPETDVIPDETEQFYREANGLDYPIFPDTGIVRQRKDVQYFPEIDQYKCSYEQQPQIEIQLKTNYGQYICGKNSYLKLKIKSNSNDHWFGSGSACNIIRRSRYVLANGEVLDNCDTVNIYNHVRDHWSRGTDYINNYGISKGYQSAPASPPVSDELIIPLGDILPIFNVDSLLPPEMVSKCTITLELEKPILAYDRFQGSTVQFNELEYTVSDISVVMDSYFIDTDFVNLMHKKQIIIEYPTYESFFFDEKDKGSYAIELEISKTRVVNVVCRPTILRTDQNTASVDSMVSDFDVYDTIKNQDWKVGNQKYPTFDRNRYDDYVYNYRTFKADKTEPLLKPDDAEAFGDHYIECLDLERSKYNVEGFPINNKNLIKYFRTNENNDSADIKFHFFVTYMKRVQVMPLTPEQDALLQFPNYDITE
jgi:hypothetical protein